MADIRDHKEAMLERRVSDAQSKVDEAKGEHAAALRDLRKYRRDRAKAEVQSDG